MKILYLCETVDYGVGENLKDLIQGGLARGHEIHLVYSRKRTGERFKNWIKSESGAKFTADEISMERSPGVRDVAVVWRVLSVLKKIGRVDLIHGLSSKGGAIARIVGRLKRIPSFYSPHAYVISDPSLSFLARNFYSWIEAALNQRAFVVCTSREEMEITQRLGCSSLRFIPNGVDVETIDAPELGRKELNISFVGRFSEQKNPGLFLRIAESLSDLPFNFHMFGDGKLFDQVRQMPSVSLQKKVKFWGRVNLDEIWENTDVLICTSRYEGFPYVFIQALAHGVPILSTGVGGTESVIEPFETGIVFDGEADLKIRDFLSCFLDNDFRSRIRATCVLKSREFSVASMLDQTFNFYSSGLRI